MRGNTNICFHILVMIVYFLVAFFGINKSNKLPQDVEKLTSSFTNCASVFSCMNEHALSVSIRAF